MNKKNILLIIFSIILTLIYFGLPENKVEKIKQEENISIKEEIIVKVLNENDIIEEVELEEYIIGVVAAEMPASFNEEALKAQAVASRTYAMYKILENARDYHVTTDVTTQSYITKDQMYEKWEQEYEYYYNKIKQAVLDTENLVLKYAEEIICSFYFSMSNGYTENSISVFNQNLEYITSVESIWDKSINNFEFSKNISKNIFCEKLEINCNLITIDSVIRNQSNRVEEIIINNKKYSGTEIRSKLDLRSTDFEIIIGEEINITTRGYGHGVGMSQYGANELAKLNNSYEEILNYYYKDIKILPI